MAILKNILKESLEYYRDLGRRYQARLKELPRGSILKRRISSREYYYQIYREGERIVSKYLGKAEPEKIQKEIEERRQIKRQLKEVQENLRMLQRIAGRRKNGRPVSKNP